MKVKCINLHGDASKTLAEKIESEVNAWLSHANFDVKDVDINADFGLTKQGQAIVTISYEDKKKEVK